ncbi:MAG: alpha amylase N-terminal ig-like domain-containing protein [Clostridia bacterium]|nr:alpha amylase N-terminal ig-like domain-containing protein [Clostridia bacterium]
MQNIQWAAVHHMPWLEYRHTLPDGRICIRIQTARDDFDQVTLLAADMYSTQGLSYHRAVALPMDRLWQDENRDYYQCVFERVDKRIHYLFRLTRGQVNYLKDQDTVYVEDETFDPSILSYYPYPHAYKPQPKPQWARGCAGYQIFPDRFRRGVNPAEPDEPVEPWTSTHYENEYRFGGNLQGIRDAVPYLHKLGVGVVYMCPIFVSNTSHRYNTFDYLTIDPLLGTKDDLKGLAADLHARGMRLVLDGVFNHSGTQFPPFVDAMKHGKESPYYDWYLFGEEYPFGYATFGTTPEMPKLNLSNSACQAYFLEVARYWIREADIDGWRLDVSPEVWPDFWRMYRKAVQKEKKDFLMIAECWDDSRQWLTLGDMFDSTMHYVLSRPMWQFFGEERIDLRTFDHRINRIQMMYPQAIQETLWTFLDSHDTARCLHLCGEDESRLKGAVFFQMTYPGVPIVYYGDELGLTGGPDPDCRRPMPWDKVENNPMFDYYQRLIALRAATPVLREGSFRTVEAGADGLYVYLREMDGQRALMALNTSRQPLQRGVILPRDYQAENELICALTGKSCAVNLDQAIISLQPGEGCVFLLEEKA